MNRKICRRRFLGQASCAGLGFLTLKNSIINLQPLNAAAISNSSVYDNYNDYKAIVCILLAGGNDSFNMLVPTDTSRYNQYSAARSHLALPLSSLSSTQLQYNNVNINYAAHPSMTGVKDLFNSKRLSFLTNVGTLTHPNTTKAQIDLGNSPLGLFSHSDQIEQWQTGLPTERGAKGWAGRIGDLISDCNSNQNISMNISLSGSNIFQNGEETVEYAVDPYYGAVGLDGYDSNAMYLTEQIRTQAIDSLLGQTYQDIFEKTFVNVIKNAKDGFVQFDAAMQNAITFPQGAFPDSELAASLEMIARTISIRNNLGFKRQVFFVIVGGWDHHDGLLDNQQAMLGMVSDALFSFQESLKAKFGSSNQYNGVNVENNVLTMFISEFGRTLRPNLDGTDHAWGGNTMVMGGPNLIDGGKVFGAFPSMVLGNNNPLELDNSGRFIPTLSTDQYFGEVAQWFGVPSTDMALIFPNIGNFYNPLSTSHPIGFIK
ncbi:MAG: DUF1501 domain-containing protein [Saprospiraceae bacterium]|nr:DUF1501 domain-containing protein [Saprospiraceae bacterium]